MASLWFWWFICLVAVVYDRGIIQPIKRHRNRQSYVRGHISSGLLIGFTVITLILSVRQFYLDFFYIPTPSMEPLVASESTVGVRRDCFGYRSPFTGLLRRNSKDPTRGDVIVFQYPREPSTAYVKRVYAVGGDLVVLSPRGIEVNGRFLPTTPLQEWVQWGVSEPFVLQGVSELANHRELRIPYGHLFVMGDNLAASQDSRHWGLVSQYHLLGKLGTTCS